MRIIIAVCLLLGCLSSGSGMAKTAPEKPRGDIAAENIETQLDKKFAKGKYSKKGADTCLKCHDTGSDKPATGIFDTPHGHLGNSDTPMAKYQCESCHGPADKHAKSKLRKGKTRQPMITFGPDSPLSSNKQNSVCLSCHDDHARFAWQGSPHQSQEVPCASCHTLHKGKDPMLSREGQAEACGTCHRQQGAATHQLSSHPLQWGDMVCSDCHAPHGSLNDTLLKAETVNDNCASCHQEKSGPKLWEHAPVAESCTTCHNPHGSNLPRLLKQPIPLLCQSCHSSDGHPSISYGGEGLQTKFVAGDSCLNCHNKIHGSNHPSGASFQR